MGIDIAAIIERYLESSLARGHSPETVAYRRVYLGQLQRWLLERGITELGEVSRGTLADYVMHMASRQTSYKRAVATRLSVWTVATATSVLRSLFSWAAVARLIQANPADGLRVHSFEAPPPRAVLTEDEAARLMEAPPPEGVGLRDRAILETLYSTGLRRAELCGLDCYDIHSGRGEVFVRQAKGGRERMVPIGRRALEAIHAYAGAYRRQLAADRREPALFLSTVGKRRLGVKAVNLIVAGHATRAGIPWRVMPITLRHTCATHLLQAGADVREVQQILGHAWLTSTQIYTRVTTGDLIAAHHRHHPRDRRGRPLKERCTQAYAQSYTRRWNKAAGS